MHLAQLIKKRLPIESHVTVIYKERVALLSKQQKATETPKTVFYRLKIILTEARNAIRDAEVWAKPAYKLRTNHTGKLIQCDSTMQLKV